jgi:LPPG:FO 2-phospho-L-lactate transferase
MMTELGHSPSSLTVARKYRGLIDGFIIDRADAEEASQIEAMGIAVEIMDTLMLTLDDSVAVSRVAIALAAKLSSH